MSTITKHEPRLSLTEEEACFKSPIHSLTGVQVLATGSYVPANVVRNEDLAVHGFDADWIVQRTGIHQRRRAAPGETTSDLAYQAAMNCLEQAGRSPAEIDLILVATMTPDTPCPSTACHLHRRLGVRGIPAMDLNAACAGFAYGMVTGMQFVKNGTSQLALVVGTDLMSVLSNPHDKKTYPLFGDGAGAVLIGAGSREQGLLAYTLGADGTGTDVLCVPAGGSREPMTVEAIAKHRQYLHMEGRAVFKWAVRMLHDAVLDVLQHASLTPGDIDVVVLHQANMRIIDAAIDDLCISRERVIVNVQNYGNTSAGSIPLALDEAHRQGRISRGDHVLLCGFGAGLAWGVAVVKW